MKNQEIRNNLKQIIKEKGIEQNWIADQLNISKEYLNDIINNKDQPTLLLAFQLCNLLQREIQETFLIIEKVLR